MSISDDNIKAILDLIAKGKKPNPKYKNVNRSIDPNILDRMRELIDEDRKTPTPQYPIYDELSSEMVEAARRILYPENIEVSFPHFDPNNVQIIHITSETLTLDELLDGITEENRHGETDWGPPVGNEYW